MIRAALRRRPWLLVVLALVVSAAAGIAMVVLAASLPSDVIRAQ